MNVLGFGTYDKNTHPRVGILLEGLQDRGFAVHELNAPLGIGTAGRVEALSNLASLVRFGLTIIGRWATLIAGSRQFRGKNRPEAVLVGYLGHFDVVLAKMLFPRSKIVLDHLIFASDTAKDRGANSKIKLALLRWIDNVALRCADLILVDTPEHEKMVPGSIKKPVLVIPVGAPTAWFEARNNATQNQASVHKPDETSIVFYGLFTPLQGAPAIAGALALAAQNVPLKITMVGTGQDYEQCRQALIGIEVAWLDWVDAADLPALVADHDICIGILGTTSKAEHVVPNKVYQGMAAGCCVVTSDTIPQRSILGDAVMFCPPGDAAGLAKVIEHLATDWNLLSKMKQVGAAKADTNFQPNEVVAPLVEALS